MIKAAIFSMCLAISALSLNARAQDVRGYSYGPVTEVDYLHVEYGHFDEYMAWVTSTWVPTMEAAKKAGLIIGYKVFQASPKSPDQPNVYLEITYKNMAAYAGDIGDLEIVNFCRSAIIVGAIRGGSNPRRRTRGHRES